MVFVCDGKVNTLQVRRLINPPTHPPMDERMGWLMGARAEEEEMCRSCVMGRLIRCRKVGGWVGRWMGWYFTHSVIQSFVHSLNYPPIQYFIRSSFPPTHPPTHPHTHLTTPGLSWAGFLPRREWEGRRPPI